MTAEATPRVQVLVSTMGERIQTLHLPEPRPGVGYVVVHQTPEAQPLDAQAAPNWLLQRSDVRYVPLDTVGLSLSRNAALQAATAPWVALADDDLDYDLDALARLIGLAERRGADIACGYHRWADGTSTLGSQPPARLRRTTIGSVTSIDIVARRARVGDAGVRFDPSFGLGARWPSCEETVFLADALAAGLTIWRFPVELATHPVEHSGADLFSTVERVRIRRAMLDRIFGRRAVLFALAFWAKHLPAALRSGRGVAFTKGMFTR